MSLLREGLANATTFAGHKGCFDSVISGHHLDSNTLVFASSRFCHVLSLLLFSPLYSLLKTSVPSWFVYECPAMTLCSSRLISRAVRHIKSEHLQSSYAAHYPKTIAWNVVKRGGAHEGHAEST